MSLMLVYLSLETPKTGSLLADSGDNSLYVTGAHLSFIRIANIVLKMLVGAILIGAGIVMTMSFPYLFPLKVQVYKWVHSVLLPNLATLPHPNGFSLYSEATLHVYPRYRFYFRCFGEGPWIYWRKIRMAPF